ncbi:MAG TPA: hypothetical protein VLZ06_04485 [Solirubrobacteraceae bacterium]|nr:hypothetical protein [Solirubrobacteraceae bacterium]
MAGLPDGITLDDHRDLRGRARYVWVRRGLLCAISALPVLALLDVFGQKPLTSSAAGPAARLSVTAPERLRSGLVFQVEVEVDARRDIRQLRLEFTEGWWESMSVNSIVPEPEGEDSERGRVQLTYGNLRAGESLVSRIYFQVNPTNVGKRREDVILADGETPLLTVERSLTIFP